MEKTGLVILLCRNALHYSRACLDTILAQTVPVSVLVIDNASTDGTAKYMAHQQAMHERIYRMAYPQVASVSRCWNEGLQWGWGRGHKEALVVNNDTELLPATYEKLVAPLHAYHWGILTAVGVASNPGYPSGPLAPRPHPDYSCFMIAQWAHKCVPFDQTYEGGYFEDARNHVMMHRAGIWAGSINLGFLHHSSGTLKNADVREQDRINTNYQHNKALFLRQYGCVPGTKAYENLFLPDARANNVPADPEQAQEPQAEHQHHDNRDERFDRGGHRDVGLDQPEHHANDH